MTILVTNDDGYTEGLRILLNSAKKMDSTYALIPNKQQSGVSKAITLHKPLRIFPKEKEIYEVNGTPADCVTLGIFSKDFPTPKLVLSGINWGDNSSLHSIYTSGTLAACVESVLFNIPAIGFSIYRKKEEWKNKEKSWGNEKELAKHIISISTKLSKEFDGSTLFSVNFPNRLTDSEIIVAKPQRHRFNVQINKRIDPDGRNYYWITGPDSKKEKNKDFYLINSGKIVITPITLEPVKDSVFSNLKKIME
ncbi:MAG: 5'/3'-nucleotidase SurE [Candidatus ainarchaeum sp.]|nr:5'/3'-nucleotidase SurE [Candidatus ainarchaeum sp.]